MEAPWEKGSYLFCSLFFHQCLVQCRVSTQYYVLNMNLLYLRNLKNIYLCINLYIVILCCILYYIISYYIIGASEDTKKNLSQ